MISVCTVQFSEDHASPFMSCVGNRCSIVAQLVSKSELLLDPYYRAFDGFQILTGCQWFAFEHRFPHRSNQSNK